jgi:hypothetical protein
VHRDGLGDCNQELLTPVNEKLGCRVSGSERLAVAQYLYAVSSNAVTLELHLRRELAHRLHSIPFHEFMAMSENHTPL